MNKKLKLVLEIVTLLLCILVFLPFLLMLINAGKDSFAVTDRPLDLPTDWMLIFSNMKKIWFSENIRYGDSFISSVIITIGSLLVITLSAAMAAWVLVRRKSLTSTLIFFLFVASMVIPFQVLMLPLVAWFRIVGEITDIKLLRSYTGIIFAYMGFGVPLSIFLFHGFIKSIPLEIEDAAEMDGCNKLQTFIYIIFPILKPIYVTVVVLNGIWIWNDFLLPVLVLGKGNDIQTIPIAVANFVGSFVKEWDLILTAALMSIIPVVILFIFAQRYIIRGMVEGSVK